MSLPRCVPQLLARAAQNFQPREVGRCAHAVVARALPDAKAALARLDRHALEHARLSDPRLAHDQPELSLSAQHALARSDQMLHQLLSPDERLYQYFARKRFRPL